MKRFFAVLFVLALFVNCSFAETDLSTMSYNDLVALQKQIVFEIMSRPEWKEVEVHAGTWDIGEDIPAGKYSIKSTDDVNTIWYTKRNGIRDFVILDKDETIGKIELLEGTTFETTKTVIFAPPLSLGF